MANQQILDYIKQQTQQGLPKEIISSNLLSQGWQQSDIDEAFSQTAMSQNLSTPEIQSIPSGDAEKNVSSIIGVVLGIFGLLTWFVTIINTEISEAIRMGMIGIGLIYGFKGLKSLKRGLAIVAIVLSFLGFLMIFANIYGDYRLETGQSYWLNDLLGKDSSASKTELINRMVPKIKDKLSLREVAGITWVDVTAEPSAIRLHYIISSAVDNGEINNESLKIVLVAISCQDKALKELLNRDIHMESSYSVKNSTQKYFVSVTKTDCD